jgi:hypothetical protein
LACRGCLRADFGFHLLPRLLGLFHRAFVFCGRDIAGIAILNDALEDAPHDLAVARFGKHIHEVQVADYGDRPEFATHLVKPQLERAG